MSTKWGVMLVLDSRVIYIPLILYQIFCLKVVKHKKSDKGRLELNGAW